MDQRHHIRIVDFKEINYTDKKTQQPAKMRLAQCVITSKSEEGGQKTIVGELLMPRHLNDVPVGEYLAEFELAVGQDLRVGSRLAKLHAVNAKAVPNPMAKAA